MNPTRQSQAPVTNNSPWRTLGSLALAIIAAIAGIVAAIAVLPGWLPGLTFSLLGEQPKAFWHLARASGIVAYLLFWVSVMLGLAVSGKVVRLWRGGPSAVDLHQFVTWLAIVTAVFHMLILLADRFVGATPVQVLLPFAYVAYRPVWVGLGQLGLYAAIVVAASTFARKRLSYRMWRTLHYASFAVYLLLVLHGLLAGTDSTIPAVKAMYAITGLSVYFLTLYRIFQAIRPDRTTANAQARAVAINRPHPGR